MPWWGWVLVGLGVLLVVYILVGQVARWSLERRASRGEPAALLVTRGRRSGVPRNPPPNWQSSADVSAASEMAEGVVMLARQHRADGMDSESAVVLAFEEMQAVEQSQGDPRGLNEWILMIAKVLAEHGVLNDWTMDQMREQIIAFDPATLLIDPGIVARTAGVRDIDAWP